MTRPDAESTCQQRNSFLPRVLNSNIQSTLGEFRNASYGRRDVRLWRANIWIDVKADFIDEFDWIDGSPLAG